ncbi:MAG: ATPase domain-containing protein [Promethearchaeota archaeon]
MNLSEILNINDLKIIEKKEILKESLKNKEKKYILDTGSKNFNDIIGGGFHPGRLYLIFGAYKTGKTQLCHQICVQTSQKIIENKKFKIIYIDTENSFRPERIFEIAVAHNFSCDNILKNIYVSKIMSNYALWLQLQEIENYINKLGTNLIIIDSINNHFRAEQGNNNISFFKVKSTFLKILNSLNYITKKYEIITIVTAQIRSIFSKKSIIKEVPVGMQFLNHFFAEQLYLSNRDEKISCAHLVNSQFCPEKKILYKITSKGIIDYNYNI